MIKLKDLLKESIGGMVSLTPKNNPFPERNPKSAFTLKESPAEDDAKAAQSIQKDLLKVLQDIDKGMNLIEKKLSGFNAPGLKHAFIGAISKATKRQGKFDIRLAEKVFGDYFKDR